MVFLRFTYQILRLNRLVDGEPYLYRLVNADPVEHGGQWSVYDLNGNFICE
jgi:hypothetical protein